MPSAAHNALHVPVVATPAHSSSVPGFSLRASVKSLIVMMFMMLPLLVGLASFGTFLALDGVLTAPVRRWWIVRTLPVWPPINVSGFFAFQVVFKSLALFNALRFPLIALPSRYACRITTRHGPPRCAMLTPVARHAYVHNSAQTIVTGLVSLARVEAFLQRVRGCPSCSRVVVL